MTLTVDAEDDSGNGCDLCAIQEYVGSFAAVVMDQSRVGESVERAGWRRAGESEFVETGEQQIATRAIFVSRFFKIGDSDVQRCDAGPLRGRRNTVG